MVKCSKSVRAPFFAAALLIMLLCACLTVRAGEPAADGASAVDVSCQADPQTACEICVNIEDASTQASYTRYFAYDDSMVPDSCAAGELSPEIAKASVYLSMGAYYPDKGSTCSSLYSQMGYELCCTSPWYSKRMSYRDCDHAAFTIAKKEAGEKVIYLVPVRGSHDPREWYSNFHVGNLQEHEGFRKAADEVLNELTALIRSDKHRPEDVFIWLTGHSRGAAVANLAAASLAMGKAGEGLVDPENVTAYTFACPAVTRGDAGDLKNIYNYNNPYDLIPALPMGEEGWNFDRYGTTITLSDEDGTYYEMMRRFRTVTGTNYEAFSPKDLISLLYHLMPTVEEARIGSNQALLDVMVATVLISDRIGFYGLMRDLSQITGNLSRSILEDARSEARAGQYENIVKLEEYLEKHQYIRAGLMYARIAAGTVHETLRRELRVLGQIEMIKWEMAAGILLGEGFEADASLLRVIRWERRALGGEDMPSWVWESWRTLHGLLIDQMERSTGTTIESWDDLDEAMDKLKEGRFVLWKKLIRDINEAQRTALAIEDRSPEWDLFLEANSTLISDIREAVGIEVREKSDLDEAEAAAEENVTEGVRTMYDLISLFGDSDPARELMNGHTLVTYEIWLDSMY